MEPARLINDGDGRFRLIGDLDLATVALLADASARMLEAPPGPLVLDLAGVSQTNSAGLALLLRWTATLRKAGRELTIESLPPALRRIAELTNVDRLLPVGRHAA